MQLSKKTKFGIMKEGLNSIRRILEGAVGSIATRLIIEFGKLWAI
jgi:hypothetical protein